MDRPLTRLLRGRRRGDAVVEFVLLAPMLLLILFGILEVGRVVDAWLIVENAVREGAREGTTVPYADPTSSAQQATLSYLNSALAGRGDVVNIVVPTPYVDANTIAVSADVDIQIYTPLIQNVLSSPVHVTATAAMRRQ